MTQSLNISRRILKFALSTVLALGAVAGAHAQESVIRKALIERIPNLPPITAVLVTSMPGIYEVDLGSQIIYTDAKGEHIIEGSMVATKGMRNLTQERLDVINAVPWSELPINAAVVNKFGTGARKMVVFADPNCPYCRKLETETISKLKDVTVYTVIIPILSADSTAKAKAILCSKDIAAAWNDWTLKGVQPSSGNAACDSTKTIDANLAFARNRLINATPTILFPNGKRVASALSVEQLEPLLSSSQ